jgi:hypothetical protein
LTRIYAHRSSVDRFASNLHPQGEILSLLRSRIQENDQMSRALEAACCHALLQARLYSGENDFSEVIGPGVPKTVPKKSLASRYPYKSTG